MTKKNQTAWDRINEKVEELRDAIIEELESGELVKILDCAWANSFDLEYEMNVTVDFQASPRLCGCTANRWDPSVMASR